MDCVFCKIVEGKIPAEKIYEDNEILAFNDLEPKAPVHILLIPKSHIACVAEINPKNSTVVAKIFEKAAEIALKMNLKDGFRIVTNCGAHGGQSVPHLHFHLLGGRVMGWPPG